MDAPPIKITEQDQERLEGLLKTKEVKKLPGLDALREEIDRANVVAADTIAADVVTMNSTVRFVDEDTSMESELSLVYPHSAGRAGTVSILAPVGSALLGLSVGQSIAWQTHGGKTLQLKVIAVTSQPEAQKQFHR